MNIPAQTAKSKKICNSRFTSETHKICMYASVVDGRTVKILASAFTEIMTLRSIIGTYGMLVSWLINAYLKYRIRMINS